MGIAKRVLREFLEDVTDANYALAGYAQAQPADGSNAVPQKHWIYEARTADRFSLIEANYAYRIGYNENFAGALIDNPSDILKLFYTIIIDFFCLNTVIFVKTISSFFTKLNNP